MQGSRSPPSTLPIVDDDPEDTLAQSSDLPARVDADLKMARLRAEGEAALRDAEAKLAIGLADAQQLQRISSSLIKEEDIDALYGQLLDAARALMRSDMASIQRVAPERNELFLLAQKGFAPESAEFWEWVRADDTTSCGAALARGEPVIVPDVELWDFVAGTEDLRHYRLCGMRAMLSMPLMSRNGHLVGVMSTHWREVHQPSERESRLFEVLARQAADLIERRTAEEALRESRAKLACELEDTKQLQKISGLIIAHDSDAGLYEHILDAAMAIMRAEFGSIQMLDAERRELRLLAWRNFHPESAAYWYRVSVESGTSCGSALCHGERIVVPDVRAADFLQGTEGLRHYLLSGITAVQSTPLTTREGRLIGMISTGWRARHEPSERDLALFDVLARQTADVLERRRAQEALRSSEAWLAGQKEAFQAAINGAPLEESLGVLVRTAVEQMGEDVRCAFYIADRAGRELCHVTGMPESYAECVNGFKISRESVACGLAAHTAQPVLTPDVTEDPLWKPWLWLAEKYDYRGCWSFPVETSSGKVVGTFEVYFKSTREATPRDHELAALLTRAAALLISRNQDVEERTRAEAALRESEAALREADRSKNEFLAMLGHELRNPLAPLRGVMETLQRQKLEGPALERAYAMMDRQVAHLSRLVDDLLDVSRITRGLVELRKEPVSLAEIADRAIEMATPAVEGRGHDLNLSLPRKPLRVEGDRTRLTQVLFNLLNNAAKYTDPGGKIWLTVEREGDRAVVRVRDNGTGMKPDLVPKVFELFTQGERTLDRSQGGLGLGLALVKRLVEMHGGTVEARSEGPDTGSEFIVRLPALPAGAEKPPPTPPSGPPPSAEQVNRILVVDDVPDIAESFSWMLVGLAREVKTVHSGAEAVELARDFQPDLVLCDLGMPGMDGYETCRRLRQLPGLARAVIAAISGYEEQRQQSQEAGFDRHLVKPIGAAVLEELVKSAAARK